MRSNTLKNNKIYYEDKYYQNEKRQILKNCWFLVGNKNDFIKKNDFVTFNILNYEILLYFFGNNIYRAFDNFCPHRGSQLKNENKGNSSLICPYHFWAYDQNGEVIRIPAKEKIFKKSSEYNSIKLSQWNIDFCGDFIFASNKKNKKSLKSYLGKRFSEIQKTSQYVGSFIQKQSWIWDVNWKIAVENSLDEYHAVYAHQNTFKRTVELNPEYERSNNVYLMQMPLKQNLIQGLSKYKRYMPKYFIDKYSHIHLFPFNSISTSHGLIFFQQNYMPLSSEKTLVESSFYFNKKFEEKSTKSIKDYLIKTSKDFNEEVFNEDYDLCKRVQKGFNSDYIVKPTYGNFEKRINFFIEKIYSMNKI